MLSQLRQDIQTWVGKYLPGVTLDFIHPPEWAMGQIGIPFFSLAKQKRTQPNQLAQELEKQLSKDTAPMGISRAQAAGPYLNFFLDWEWVAEEIRKKTQAQHFISPKPLNPSPPILIEYSSPNLAKPLGVHHLRSTMIGQVLSNLYQHEGYRVIRYNYLGDMGASFGQLCVGAQKLYGDDWLTRRYTIQELYKAYIEFHQHENDKVSAPEASKFTHDLELKTPYLLGFHQEVVQVTKSEFENIYRLLGVQFDVWDGEFSYANQTPKVLSMLKKIKEVQIKISEGAQVLHFEKDILPSLILIKSDATSVYLARDVLSAEHRFQTYHPSQMIYVVGSEQTLHMKQLRYLMQRFWANATAPEMVHVPYGLMSIEGLKMSTRQGRVVLLQDVIQEGTEEMHKRMGDQASEAMAQKLAVGAIIFGDLFQGIAKNIKFRWEDILNVEGDTGPYVYYAYARLSGILRKMSLTRDQIGVPKKIKLVNQDPVIHQILFHELEFEDVAQKSVENHDPSLFARYLLSLAKAANAFYHAHPIKDESDASRRETLLWVLKTIQDTLRYGAKLLNMELLEEL